MENQEGETHELESDASNSSAARFSVGCGVAALICMIFTVITDNVLLLVPLFLLGMAGVVLGFVNLILSKSARGVAVLGIVLSGIWALLGAALLFALAMWDSNL